MNEPSATQQPERRRSRFASIVLAIAIAVVVTGRYFLCGGVGLLISLALGKSLWAGFIIGMAVGTVAFAVLGARLRRYDRTPS